jgi:photosystem II stability/assembly factor-like uncharacterized protein
MKKCRTLGLIAILTLSSVGTPDIYAQINEWTSLGWLEGGNVQSLVIDPQNPNTLYATGSPYVRGVGIFKSTNGGANWRAINFGLTNTTVSSLVIVPQNPSTIYAGTSGSGVFKSTDGGESWGSTSLPNTFVITALAAGAPDPATVYVAAYVGIPPTGVVSGNYKSTDGGVTWTQIAADVPGQIQVLTIDPHNPGTVYAVADGGCCSDPGLYKSADDGLSWTIVPGMEGCFVTAVVFPRQDPKIIYAAGSCYDATGSEATVRTVFRSTDAGASWQRVNDGLPEIALISALTIDPQDPATLYAGTPVDGVFKTTDGGTTWQAVYPGLKPPSVNALAIDPQNPNRIYIGSGTGVLTSTDGGASWNSANSGLHANPVTALALDPEDSSTLYAAALGKSFINESGKLQDAAGGLFKSTDRGTTWNSVNPAINAVTERVIVAPDRAVYACTTYGLFKSSDAGTSWTALSPFPTAEGVLGPNPNFCGTVAIDPENPATIYAGDLFSGVLKSADGGTTWRTAHAGLPAYGNLSLPVRALAIDPTNPERLYAATDAFLSNRPIPYGLFQSTDGATTWNPVALPPTDQGIRALVIAAQVPSAMYAATFAGLFKSIDAGTTWSSVNFGIDTSSVWDLAVDPQNPSTLYAATGRGILTITFASQGPPLVNDFEFSQTSVAIGNSFIARASGLNLTAQTYLDVLYRAPGSTVDQEALNWQTGAAAVHSVSAAIARGIWTVTGIRAHEDETDHTGSYVPVSTSVNVLERVP